MKTVQATDAKVQFGALLDAAAAGETVVIMRRGEAVARLVPEDLARRLQNQMALERLDALRSRMPKLNNDEIRDSRDLTRGS